MVYITSNVNQCDSGNPLCFLFSSWIYLWIRLKQIPRTELLRMLTPKVVNFIVILQVLFYRINTNWLLSFFFLKEYVFSNFLLHCIYPFSNITTGRLDLVAWHLSSVQHAKLGTFPMKCGMVKGVYLHKYHWASNPNFCNFSLLYFAVRECSGFTEEQEAIKKKWEKEQRRQEKQWVKSFMK